MAMDQNKTALERAFEIARSGQFATYSEIKRAVAAEGYSLQQLDGKSLAQQLRSITKARRAAPDFK
jgi:hypothetical protein